jgi:hypothetical protein
MSSIARVFYHLGSEPANDQSYDDPYRNAGRREYQISEDHVRSSMWLMTILICQWLFHSRQLLLSFQPEFEVFPRGFAGGFPFLVCLLPDFLMGHDLNVLLFHGHLLFNFVVAA